MTQQSMAQQLMIERSTYNKIESAKTELTITMLERIVSILETDMTILLDLDKHQVNNVSNNNGTFSVQGINITMHINLPKEIILELEKLFFKNKI